MLSTGNVRWSIAAAHDPLTFLTDFSSLSNFLVLLVVMSTRSLDFSRLLCYDAMICLHDDLVDASVGLIIEFRSDMCKSGICAEGRLCRVVGTRMFAEI